MAKKIKYPELDIDFISESISIRQATLEVKLGDYKYRVLITPISRDKSYAEFFIESVNMWNTIVPTLGAQSWAKKEVERIHDKHLSKYGKNDELKYTKLTTHKGEACFIALPYEYKISTGYAQQVGGGFYTYSVHLDRRHLYRKRGTSGYKRYAYLSMTQNFSVADQAIQFVGSKLGLHMFMLGLPDLTAGEIFNIHPNPTTVWDF